MVGGGQSKIGKLTSHALVGDQNVLRLQIPVVDSDRVAIFNSIQDLKESTLSPLVIADEFALLGDVREQVTFWAVLNDDVGAVRSVHDLDQRNNVGVNAGLVVKLNLTLLKLVLTRLEANFVKRLHSIRNVGLDVHGGIDHSIGTNSENASELEPTSKNLT